MSPEKPRTPVQPKISWDQLPKPKKSDFSPEAPFQLELLIRISENMKDDPEMSFNQAVFVGVGIVRNEIARSELLYSEVSKSIESYLDEFPEIAAYIRNLVDTSVITRKGTIKNSVAEFPTYENFIDQQVNS